MSAVINDGDVAWVLASSTLVMFMTPGLGFFYGGLVRKQNMITTIAYCFIVYALVTIVWALLGFSLVFAPSANMTGILGNTDWAAMREVGPEPHSFYGPTIPLIVFFFFQLQFATITPALMLGAVVDRIKFRAMLIFTVCWVLVVYCPIAHWMWNENGWAQKWGILDFAGGNVVHIASGFSALAATLVLGKRKQQENKASSVSFILLGTAILWFGWFGFNGGSALGANGLAGVACVSTNIAAATGGVTWIFLESMHKNSPSIFGFACGAVCGLVSITPACGFCPVWSSFLIGMGGAFCSYWFCYFRSKHWFATIDDTVDAFGAHGISGVWGGIATGLFAEDKINPAVGNAMKHDGAFFGQGELLGKQIVGILASAAWSFFVTAILLYVMNYIHKIRLDTDKEYEGLDLAIQNEEAETNIDAEKIIEMAFKRQMTAQAEKQQSLGYKDYTAELEEQARVANLPGQAHNLPNGYSTGSGNPP